MRQALLSDRVLVSGQGVGFNEPFNAAPPEPPLIQRDGERHRALRNVVLRNLTPSALRQHRALLKAIIVRRVLEVIGGPPVEAVTALAQRLPLEAVTHLVGLPEEGRERMLDWAAAGFNAIGPLDTPEARAAMERDFALFAEARAYLQTVDRARLAEGSWTGSLLDAVDAGDLTPSEARAAMSAYVIPSLDTTIYAATNLLYNIGRDPEQFDRLKSDPSLVPSAVLEGVRHSATVRWFARVAVEDYLVEGFTIPAGARVMLLYGSANRDERRYADPDRFDVSRKPIDQLGWGVGRHLCAGMNLARMEMEVLLEALVEHVRSIEVGKPEQSASRGLYGFTRLPLTLC